MVDTTSGKKRMIRYSCFIKWCYPLALIGSLLLPVTGTAIASDLVKPHAAEYKVKISVLGGKLRTRVEAIDGGFRAESSIEATGMSRLIARGSIRESSIIRATDTGLRPERFISVDTLSKGGEAVDLEFDWADKSIGGTIDGDEFNTDIDGDVHDRVSLQYGLMHDLLSGIDRTQYSLQDAEKLKLLSITNIGSQQVKVPFGRFEAIGIQHQAANSSRITTLWCVEELGFLPVIIEQHRKGKRQMRAVLTEYQTL
ncbi:MAG: DUF3108 domain-containing protein [Woeseiaceae bacterium]